MVTRYLICIRWAILTIAFSLLLLNAGKSDKTNFDGASPDRAAEGEARDGEKVTKTSQDNGLFGKSKKRRGCPLD